MKKAIILVGVLLISIVFMASASAKYSQTLSDNPCQGGIHNPVLQFAQLQKPGGDGTLTVSIKGDYSGSSNERVEVVVEGLSLGEVPENSGYPDCTYFITRTFTVTKEQIQEWSADGKIEVTLKQRSAVDCFCSENINVVTLEYPQASSLPMQQFMKILGLGKKD